MAQHSGLGWSAVRPRHLDYRAGPRRARHGTGHGPELGSPAGPDGRSSLGPGRGPLTTRGAETVARLGRTASPRTESGALRRRKETPMRRRHLPGLLVAGGLAAVLGASALINIGRPTQISASTASSASAA